MNFLFLIVTVIFIYPLYSSDDGSRLRIDTSRFLLNSAQNNFRIVDNYQNVQTIVKNEMIISGESEEKSYVSSFNYSDKVSSFTIGNGLIGLHLSSFSAMTEGSAQAAAGRDIFLIYDPDKNLVIDKSLDFGITRQRNRYMGCLSAKTSHFILADVDKNGLIDIGRIKEELICEELFDPIQDTDKIEGPFFIQDSVEWFVYENKSWLYDSSQREFGKYIDLPLIDITINPIDFFGYMKWKSYDPRKWDRKSEVNYYPGYRLILMKNH